MKKISIGLVILLTLVFAIGQAFASGIPGTGWWTGETVQNISTGQASVQVVAYDSLTTSTYSASQLIDPGKNFTFIPSLFTPAIPSGFQGSAVVSADAAIKAIVSVSNRLNGDLGVSGGKAAAIYQGVDGSAVSTTIYFPIAKGDAPGGKTTSYYIQNAGTSATNFTGTFKMKSGDTWTYTSPSVGPNQMVVFNIFDTSYVPTCTPSNMCRLGALTVQSGTTQPLAGTILEHKTTENPATLLQGTRGFTSSDFDTKAYVPVTKNNRVNRVTGVQVQNVTASTPITITITYKGIVGATCVGNTYVDQKTAIAAGASAVFNQTTADSTLPNDCMASAVVETSTPGGQIVALSSESYVTAPPEGQASTTAYAMPDHTATAKLVGPTFKDDRADKRTGLTIQNVGTVQATNVVATFECTVGTGTPFTAISLPQTLDPLKSVTFQHPSGYTQSSWFLTGKYFSNSNVVCSVTVTSDQPIVAIFNEAVTPGAALQQDKSNYEGINVTP